MLGDVRMVLQQPDRRHDQVVEVQRVRLGEPALVARVGLGEHLLVRVARLVRPRLGRDEFVLQIADLRRQRARRVALGVEVEFAADHRHQPPRVVGVVDREGRLEPERLAVAAQDAHAHRVERRHPHRCGPAGRRARRRARFISPAALFVNVIARISPGCTSRSAIRYAMRLVSTRVLPDPAPATISSGPPWCTTAARCCGLRPVEQGRRVDGEAGTRPVQRRIRRQVEQLLETSSRHDLGTALRPGTVRTRRPGATICGRFYTSVLMGNPATPRSRANRGRRHDGGRGRADGAFRGEQHEHAPRHRPDRAAVRERRLDHRLGLALRRAQRVGDRRPGRDLLVGDRRRHDLADRAVLRRARARCSRSPAE